MEFFLNKCAKATFKREKKISAEGIQLNDNKVIQDLKPEATYTYLGIDEGDGTDHHKMKARSRESMRRIRLVLKPELNARNKMNCNQYTGSPCSIMQLWSDKLETG